MRGEARDMAPWPYSRWSADKRAGIAMFIAALGTLGGNHNAF